MKKKLRDLTMEEYRKWWGKSKYCNAEQCFPCPLSILECCPDSNRCWIKHKDMLSDKFLNQEIEIEVKKSKLTEDERAILRYLNKKWKYIVRDKDKTICIFETKPFKSVLTWVCKNGDVSNLPFENMYQFIKWEDEEPYLIEDLLKEE